MLDTTAARWLLIMLVIGALIALLAWARNGPGVGGRVPDPDDAVGAVIHETAWLS